MFYNLKVNSVKKYSRGFSLLETLLCLGILAIFAYFSLKPLMQENLAINKASLHIQFLQKELNERFYQAFLRKETLDLSFYNALLQSSQVNNKDFSFLLRGNAFILKINDKQIRFVLQQSVNGVPLLTCNPSQLLCREIYRRKLNK